ncbi:MAG: patatin-like phospholipase family protein [Gallionella sp.]|nr:patatin-like phospholipase family protein [Gallionella sp.]MDD4960021.1 patatin-like phospholipase family protein [Gallionella sp.]
MFTFKEICDEEWKIIREGRDCARRVDIQEVAEIQRDALKAEKTEKPHNLVGLAFSGGGIRSATFNLGVLQGLAEAKLLKRVDYLSTVSGGGYIGSWFSALLHRKAATEKGKTPAEKVAQALKKLQDELTPSQQAPDGNSKADHEFPNGQESIQWLRRYSSYLTPRYGLFKLDTLAAMAGLFRNLLLNQTILICLLMAILLVPYDLMEIGRLVTMSHEISVSSDSNWMLNIFNMLSLFSCVALFFAIYFVRQGLTEYQSGNALGAVLLAFMGSGMAALVFYLNLNLPLNQKQGLGSLVCLSIGGGLLYLLSWIPSFLRHKSFNLLYIPITSIGLAGMLYGYGILLQQVPSDLLGAFSLVWGPVIILQILCMAAIVHTGLVSRGFSEINREWLGRAGGQVFALEMAWVMFTSFALFAPGLVAYLNVWVAYSGGVAWGLGSIATFLLSRGNKSGGKKSDPSLEKALSIAPYLVVLGLLIVLSTGLHKGLLALDGIKKAEHHQTQQSDFTITIKDKKFEKFEASPHDVKPSLHQEIANTLRDNAQIAGVSLLSAFVIFSLVGLLFAWRVDINLFSMHQFYRNRLTRAYLGASRKKRTPNSFTNFDEGDDLALSELSQQRPVHLVNATLNLTKVTDKKLQWQERRGASFLFTPHFCGYQLSLRPDHQCYVPTDKYMQSTLVNQKGVLLGTAVAVSGAAASPNMGYHSSPPLAFLMTFCNVRLGRWCPNPAKREIHSSSPKWGLWYLLRELFCSTNEKTEYVNLTDGGHFENLGIYELVRRQCKVILVSDAGADNMEGFQFEDLGNAIQKCRVDFGATIDIFGMEKLKPRQAQSRVAWGHITYADKSEGVLIYLKPLLQGMSCDEPVDIFHYSASNKDFPHQSTCDQWFDESQFESYRELGFITVQKMLAEMGYPKCKLNGSQDDFVALVSGIIAAYRDNAKKTSL